MDHPLERLEALLELMHQPDRLKEVDLAVVDADWNAAVGEITARAQGPEGLDDLERLRVRQILDALPAVSRQLKGVHSQLAQRLMGEHRRMGVLKGYTRPASGRKPGGMLRQKA
ncbi:MAG: hypothetical protein H7831_06105 [Magnetococcus sp. WYHC-3]